MNIGCSTCLEPITANCDSSTTPCGHVFHTDCIKNWLNRKSNCPKCRKETRINDLIKIYFSLSEEDVNKNAAADALEADLKCIELAEKNENLQAKPSLKIRTASVIFWIYLGIFRDYTFSLKLFCFSR